MNRIWDEYRLAVIAAGVVIIAVLSTVFVTPETKQAVIIRTGKVHSIVNIYKPDDPYGQTGAGFWWRIPFVDRVQMVERRVLDLDMDNQQVLTSDASLLTAERGTAMTNIRDTLDAQARQYGAQIIDVRIKAADLPEGTPLEAAFTRMISDRQEQAETIRAQGRKNAQIIRAEAEADAAKTYADAYGKDPEFYDFYRSMQSYRTTFINGEADSSMVLDGDNEYFRQFRGQ